MVTRRGRDGWFLVTWKQMRVNLCDVAAARQWEARPFAAEVEDLGDGTGVITFAQSWLPSSDLGDAWVEFAKNRYKFSCPDCAQVYPTTQTLQSHWDAIHAAAETVVSARKRGLKNVDVRGGVHMKRFGKRQLRKYVRQSLRRLPAKTELGVVVSMDYDDSAFYLLCLLPGAYSVKFFPVTGYPTTN